MAVLQAPFDEGPQFACLFLAAACQGVAGGTVSYHGTVSPIFRTMPEADAFGDDGAGDGTIVGIHVAGKMAESVQGRLVTDLITQEGEEGIDVLSLVVCPYGSIVGLTAGTMHQATLGAVDTLGTAQFGESEHAVQHRVGGVEHQFVPPLVNKGLPSGAFALDVGARKGNVLLCRRGIRKLTSGKDGVELKGLTRFQHEGAFL